MSTCATCWATIKWVVDTADPTHKIAVDPLPLPATVRWARNTVAVKAIAAPRPDKRRAPATRLVGFVVDLDPAPPDYRLYFDHRVLCRQIRPDAFPDPEQGALPFEPAHDHLTRER